ncbi:MAG: primosomal protein N', partial [Burkholderiales bacterium]
MKVIRVALDVPVAKLFDYLAPEATAADIGQRVLVPFGRQHVIGIILELAHSSELPGNRLKSATRVLRESPPLAPQDLRLMRFAADYYHHPLGAVVMGVLPARLRRPAEPTSRKAKRAENPGAPFPSAGAASPPPELT